MGSVWSHSTLAFIPMGTSQAIWGGGGLAPHHPAGEELKRTVRHRARRGFFKLANVITWFAIGKIQRVYRSTLSGGNRYYSVLCI